MALARVPSLPLAGALLAAAAAAMCTCCAAELLKEVQVQSSESNRSSQEPLLQTARHLSQNAETEHSKRPPPPHSENLSQQFENLTDQTRHHSTFCDTSESAAPSQPSSFTCTAQCPACPLCPPTKACPSPCPVIPQYPQLQPCPMPCAACPACPTCKKHIPPGYEYYSGHGYYRLHNVPVTWLEAKATCEREGAHLAIVNSQDEANLIKTLFSHDLDIGIVLFLGFHDLYKEGRYVTIFGQPLGATGYVGWNPGQPDNNNNNENCGSIFNSGGLNDMNCESKQPFVCELPV